MADKDKLKAAKERFAQLKEARQGRLAPTETLEGKYAQPSHIKPESQETEDQSFWDAGNEPAAVATAHTMSWDLPSPARNPAPGTAVQANSGTTAHTAELTARNIDIPELEVDDDGYLDSVDFVGADDNGLASFKVETHGPSAATEILESSNEERTEYESHAAANTTDPYAEAEPPMVQASSPPFVSQPTQNYSEVLGGEANTQANCLDKDDTLVNAMDSSLGSVMGNDETIDVGLELESHLQANAFSDVNLQTSSPPSIERSQAQAKLTSQARAGNTSSPKSSRPHPLLDWSRALSGPPIANDDVKSSLQTSRSQKKQGNETETVPSDHGPVPHDLNALRGTENTRILSWDTPAETKTRPASPELFHQAANVPLYNNNQQIEQHPPADLSLNKPKLNTDEDLVHSKKDITSASKDSTNQQGSIAGIPHSELPDVTPIDRRDTSAQSSNAEASKPKSYDLASQSPGKLAVSATALSQKGSAKFSDLATGDVPRKSLEICPVDKNNSGLTLLAELRGQLERLSVENERLITENSFLRSENERLVLKLSESQDISSPALHTETTKASGSGDVSPVVRLSSITESRGPPHRHPSEGEPSLTPVASIPATTGDDAKTELRQSPVSPCVTTNVKPALTSSQPQSLSGPSEVPASISASNPCGSSPLSPRGQSLVPNPTDPLGLNEEPLWDSDDSADDLAIQLSRNPGAMSWDIKPPAAQEPPVSSEIESKAAGLLSEEQEADGKSISASAQKSSETVASKRQEMSWDIPSSRQNAGGMSWETNKTSEAKAPSTTEKLSWDPAKPSTPTPTSVTVNIPEISSESVRDQQAKPRPVSSPKANKYLPPSLQTAEGSIGSPIPASASVPAPIPTSPLAPPASTPATGLETQGIAQMAGAPSPASAIASTSAGLQSTASDPLPHVTPSQPTEPSVLELSSSEVVASNQQSSQGWRLDMRSWQLTGTGPIISI